MKATQAETHEVTIPIRDAHVDATLRLPPHPVGLVVFAHGSGSSRFSPRNRIVAGVLHDSGLATLLLDLLTPQEEAVDERTAELRFDIPFLAERLAAATERVPSVYPGAVPPIGYFGASTGAAAALMAAASKPQVRAIVSRGGRPDLAEGALERVTAPTLLIVGGRDEIVLELNRRAQRALRGVTKLLVVPGATHLFEEPGALNAVADAARDWFLRYLPG